MGFSAPEDQVLTFNIKILEQDAAGLAMVLEALCNHEQMPCVCGHLLCCVMQYLDAAAKAIRSQGHWITAGYAAG